MGPLLAGEHFSVWRRPAIHDDRSVINGILLVLRAGATQAGLSERFPSSPTCYRRFSKWVNVGEAYSEKILEALARDLEERGAINFSECFRDGTSVVAKWNTTVGQPIRIIGVRAYDSDPLDSALATQRIEIIVPHRRNRNRKATQDGHPAVVSPMLEN